MDKNNVEMTRELLNCVHSLPKEALPACIWACKNPNYVYSMVDTAPYSKEKIDKLIQDCLERKDYLFLFLAVFKKQHDEKVLQECCTVKNPAPSV